VHKLVWVNTCTGSCRTGEGKTFSVGEYKGHQLCEIIISEAHSLLAHLGTSKTTTYLKDHIWWSGMVSEIKTYCESCETCARSKFAINSARSESTGYAPFFLNTGRIPQSMIWNSLSDQQFPGVIQFAEQIKLALS
jgi:hypothetical protein